MNSVTAPEAAAVGGVVAARKAAFEANKLSKKLHQIGRAHV